MKTLPPKRPGLRGRWASFGHARRGLTTLLVTQANARIHAAIACAAIGAGFLLGVSRIEWCALVLAMGLVWVAEALNTAIELLADRVSLDFHELTGKAKDIAAGGVLAAASAAAIVGLLIFLPKVIP